MKVIASAVVALLLMFTTLPDILSGKKTYLLEEVPITKRLLSPMVQKYDCRNCLFDDSLNYMCIEHSIDVKVGWDFRQRWEIATDINPVAVTPITKPAFTYKAPDTIPNVGYKYRLRL